jgi:hypothetical protein
MKQYRHVFTPNVGRQVASQNKVKQIVPKCAVLSLYPDTRILSVLFPALFLDWWTDLNLSKK